MKSFGVILLFVVLLLVPAQAQTPSAACASAVAVARAYITDADTALAENRVTDAADLLRDARLLLTRDCGRTTGAAQHGNINLAEGVTLTVPDVTPDGGVAFIRVVNLSPGLANSGASGMKQQFDVRGLGFGDFTGLIPVPSGSHTFGNLSWDFAPNSTWVLATTGLSSTASVALQPIAIPRSDLKGQARIRVIHAMPGVGRLDVESEEGTTFGTSLGWLGNQDTMVAPGDYILRAETPAGDLIIPATAFTFDANQTYVLFASGSAENTAAAPQFVTLISPQDTTRVRFVNAGSETLNVHYRPGNAMLADALAVGATSEWVDLPTSAVTFIAYRPAEGVTGQEQASLAIALRSGRDMTITIESGKMSVTDITFTP